jgi:hypothetical protein
MIVELVLTCLVSEYSWRTLAASRTRPAFIVESVINEPTTMPDARDKIEKLLLSLSAGSRMRKSGGFANH